jgi:hypothetical protein
MIIAFENIGTFQTIVDIQRNESAVGGLTHENLILQKITEL